MRFLEKLFPKLEERISVIPSPDPFVFTSSTLHGDDREEAPNSFEYYAEQIYKKASVVFICSEARRKVLSEARFKWRNKSAKNPVNALFGTNALSILENPWPGATTSDMFSRIEQHVTLVGNAYVVREGDRLRVLRPDWVEIVLSAPPDEAVKSDVVGYAYWPGGIGRNNPTIYLPEEVAHIAPIPDPSALYRGMSWITPVLDEIFIERQTTRFRMSFFRRAAFISMVISAKERVPEDEWKRFISEFKGRHQGVMDSHDTLFLGKALDVKPISHDLSSLEMKGVTSKAESRICGAAGVPPVVVSLGDSLSDSAFSANNYRPSINNFMGTTIYPLWREISGSLEKLLQVPRNAELWVDTKDVSVLNDDRKEKSEQLARDGATMITLQREGYTVDSVKEFMITGDPLRLEHDGFLSVQVQPSARINDDGTIEYIGPIMEQHSANAAKLFAEAEKIKAEADAIKNNTTSTQEE